MLQFLGGTTHGVHGFSFPNSALNQTGPNSLLVLLVGFNTSGSVVFPECDAACVRGVLWGPSPSVASIFSQSSFGQFSFDQRNSTVANVIIQTRIDTPVCGMADGWFRSARAGSPVPITAYTVRVYVYPQAAGAGTCSVSGYSNQGCTRQECNSWLRAFSGNLVVHELGHLVNVSHAAFDVNGDGVIGTAGAGSESLADDSDPMTTDGTWRGFSAASRVQARWMPCIGMPPNTTVASLSSLSAALEPVPLDTSPIALCVFILNTKTLVIMSLRTRDGPDVDLLPPWSGAVYVHVLTKAGQATAFGRLGLGDTLEYSTAAVNLTVTVTALGRDSADISFLPCLRNSPVLAAPPQGGVLTFQSRDVRCKARTMTAKVVAVSNQDALGCVSVTLVLKKDNSPAEMTALITGFRAGNVTLLARLAYTDPGPTMTRTVLFCGSDVATDFVVVTVRDAQGDGYCCQWGPGGYSVFANGRLVRSGGEFTFEENTTVPVAPSW